METNRDTIHYNRDHTKSVTLWLLAHENELPLESESRQTE